MTEKLSLIDYIIVLERKYRIQYATDILLTSLESTYGFKSEDYSHETISIPTGVIEPNKEYLENIIGKAEILKSISTVSVYDRFRNGIDEILITDDFEDPDEIMDSLHDLIRERTYGLFSKVNSDEFKIVEQFLSEVGYEPVRVSVGDSFKEYSVYFDSAIQAKSTCAEDVGTIKRITLKPYVITYWNGCKKEDRKLCGKCSFCPN